MKSVLTKLGYKSGTGAIAWRVPEALAEQFATMTGSQDPAFRIAFVHDRAELAEAATSVAATYRPGGRLWIAYPKKAAVFLPISIVTTGGSRLTHSVSLPSPKSQLTKTGSHFAFAAAKRSKSCVGAPSNNDQNATSGLELYKNGIPACG